MPLVQCTHPSPGGHCLRKGVWGCAALRPPFYASPVVRKGPISSLRVSSQDPLLRKFGNFSLYSLNFHPNFSSQAPKFGNFQFTRQTPKFGNFQFTSPPFQRQILVCKPHTSEIRADPPPLPGSPGPFAFWFVHFNASNSQSRLNTQLLTGGNWQK